MVGGTELGALVTQSCPKPYPFLENRIPTVSRPYPGQETPLATLRVRSRSQNIVPSMFGPRGMTTGCSVAAQGTPREPITKQSGSETGWHLLTFFQIAKFGFKITFFFGLTFFFAKLRSGCFPVC